MIKQLTLKNFRQHERLNLNFDAGVNVLRGANEAGKTTVMEAIAYALFGTRAARNSDLTTYGQAHNSHEVQLTFEAQGKSWHIKRSARGAELASDDVRVTGQTDTARYCETLLQLKPNTGAKLLLAHQNDLRGILQDGSAKTVELIEQLADLSQIDDIIIKLQTHYPTGNTEALLQSTNYLKESLSRTQQQLKDLGDPEQTFSQLRGQYDTKLSDAQRSIKTLQVQIDSDQVQMVQLEQQEAQRAKLDVQRLTLQDQIAQHESRLAQPALNFDPQALQDAQRALSDLQQQKAIYDDYRVMSDCGYSPSKFYTAPDLASVKEDLQDYREQLQDAQVRKADVQRQVAQWASQMQDNSTCPTCQREWEDADERRAHQAHAVQQHKRLCEELEELKVQCQQLNDMVKLLQSIADYPSPKLSEHTQWQVVSNGQYPYTYQWQGDIPQAVTPVKIHQAQQLIQTLQEQQRTAQMQEALHAQTQSDLQRATDNLQRVLSDLQQKPNAASLINDLRKKLDEQKKQQSEWQLNAKILEQKLHQAEGQYKEDCEQKERLTQDVERLTKQIKGSEHQLTQSEKANALLKILRRVRPQITSQVWQTLCVSVTQYFSVLRGSQSTVQHEVGSGFIVDGSNVASLSGSTLDILGLAIRIALINTFLGGVRFLLLDEPFAAADAQRTEQALGFLAQLGFEQIIIITHEDTTEAIANQVIAL